MCVFIHQRQFSSINLEKIWRESILCVKSRTMSQHVWFGLGLVDMY